MKKEKPCGNNEQSYSWRQGPEMRNMGKSTIETGTIPSRRRTNLFKDKLSDGMTREKEKESGLSARKVMSNRL